MISCLLWKAACFETIQDIVIGLVAPLFYRSGCTTKDCVVTTKVKFNFYLDFMNIR